MLMVEDRPRRAFHPEIVMPTRLVLACSFLLLAASTAGTPSTAGAASAANPGAPAPEKALEGILHVLKPYLIDAIPHPLYERSYNWGKQSMTFHGVRWKGLKPRVVKAPRNDGVWRKVRLDTRNWPHSLKTRVYDFKQETPERMTFKLHLACEGQVEMEQQVWESGLRLYSGSMRARFQFHAWLECESTIRVDTSGFLPDFVVRLRVTKATVLYHEPVVEHIAGFGGTAAKITGELLHDVVHQVKPSLEEKLLERINQSIVRAADTKEIRLGLGKLLKK
jgi:hypothetical protein